MQEDARTGRRANRHRVHGASGGRFCLDGQRLVAVSGEYGADGTEYRTEKETFVKVISYSDGLGPKFFKAFLKDGKILTFGDATESLNATLDGQRYSEQSWSDVRMAWSLSRVEDRSGNYLSVSYTKTAQDHGYEQYPIQIAYTGFGDTPGSRRVTF